MSGDVPFSRFKLLGSLGQGGMGVVRKALDTKTGQEVALKIASLPADATGAERFMREMRHAIAVRHPNVCEVIATGQREDGALFLVMEVIDGPRLLDVARERRAAPLLWLEVLRALALGLGAVHDKDIVHRDVKPQNVMFDARGTLKLLDFGIARSQADETVTSTGMVVGTAAYMSPEQARAEPIDARSDLFSAGLTAMTLPARGASRFSSTKLDAIQKVLAVGMFAPPLLCQLDPSAPPEIEDLFAGLFTMHPRDRIASARDLVALIDRNPVRHPDGVDLLRRWACNDIRDEEVLAIDADRELARARALAGDAESAVARALALRRATLLAPDPETRNTLGAECKRGNFRFDEDFDSAVQAKFESADLHRLEPQELRRGYELFRRTGHIEIATRVLWAYVRLRPDDAPMLRQLERNLFGRERADQSGLSIARGIKTGGLRLLEVNARLGPEAPTQTFAGIVPRPALPDATVPLRGPGRDPTAQGAGATDATEMRAQARRGSAPVADDDGTTTRWLGRILIVGVATLVVLLLVLTVRTTREEIDKQEVRIEQASVGAEVDERLRLVEDAATRLSRRDDVGAIDAASRALDLSLSVESGLRALFIRAQAHAHLNDRPAARRDLELYLERATDFRDPNIPKVKKLLAQVSAPVGELPRE